MKKYTEEELDALHSVSDLLKKQADELWEKVASLNEKISETRELAHEKDAKAVEVVTPFKRGDVIEYKTSNYRSDKKTTYRIVVDFLRFEDSYVCVRGRQVSKKGEVSGARKEAHLYGGGDDYVRVFGKINQTGKYGWEYEFVPADTVRRGGE